MASSLPTMSELELMRSLAECPICFEIPRSGIMLQCRNGHNICATCKDQLAVDECPQGRCRYLNPPTKNWTVADLVDRVPFEFPCVYAKDSGCGFKGTVDMLKRHEVICEHRPVPCPEVGCDAFLSANGLVEHFATVHSYGIFGPARPDVIETICMWKLRYNSSSELFDWPSSPCKVDAGWMFPSVSLRSGLIYIWLQMVAHSSVTEKFKCLITLAKDDYLVSVPNCPVYPIDWHWEKIMADDDCACLSTWSIRKALTETKSENMKRQGFDTEFKVTFKIISNDA